MSKKVETCWSCWRAGAQLLMGVQTSLSRLQAPAQLQFQTSYIRVTFYLGFQVNLSNSFGDVKPYDVFQVRGIFILHC